MFSSKAKSGSRLANFSPASSGWLTAALDPFHDFQYQVRGLPDERSAPSVVQVHNQTVTLTAPTSAAAGNWDGTVIYTGFNSVIGDTGGLLAVTSGGVHAYDSGALSTGRPSGALDYWSGAAGSAFKVGAPTTVGDTNGCLGSVLSTDRCRLISVGFEVHNTTAMIAKQGSLTVAQLPDPATDATTIAYFDTNVAPIDPYTTQADRGCIFAATVAPLRSVPGSNTWAAEEGVYAIPRMTAPPKDIVLLGSAAGGVFSRTPVFYDSNGLIASPCPRGTPVLDGFAVPTFHARNPSGFSPMQVWFSGMSPSTSLTITFRTIVEYFPALGSTLLPLSEPSPVYDQAVLACYSAVITEAPYAVPVEQNSAGEYFRKVGRIISSALTIGSPLFGSFAPLVAALGQVGHNAFAEPKGNGSPQKAPFKPKIQVMYTKPKRPSIQAVYVKKDEAGAGARQLRRLK